MTAASMLTCLSSEMTHSTTSRRCEMSRQCSCAAAAECDPPDQLVVSKLLSGSTRRPRPAGGGGREPSGRGAKRRLDQRATSEADQRIADRLSALVDGRPDDNEGDDDDGPAGALVPVG
jgi:hypothetical protein